MKIKMLENYQNVEECATDALEGFRVKALGKDMEYIVSDALGMELIEARKAVKVESVANQRNQFLKDNFGHNNLDAETAKKFNDTVEEVFQPKKRGRK